MISCKNLSFSYFKENLVLNSLSLEVKPGITLLLGANGCGKSTLLRILAGVEMPDSGEIFINGIPLWQEEVKARQNLVYFPEYPDLTPYATIGEIVDLVCRLRGEPLEKGVEALNITGVLHLKNRTVRELSNGQKRRAIFSCCLLGTAPVILLDEPLEGMDQQMQTKLLEWITLKRQSGATILLACHNFNPFRSVTDRVITLHNGRAEQYGDLSSYLNRKQG